MLRSNPAHLHLSCSVDTCPPFHYMIHFSLQQNPLLIEVMVTGIFYKYIVVTRILWQFLTPHLEGALLMMGPLGASVQEEKPEERAHLGCMSFALCPPQSFPPFLGLPFLPVEAETHRIVCHCHVLEEEVGSELGTGDLDHRPQFCLGLACASDLIVHLPSFLL